MSDLPRLPLGLALREIARELAAALLAILLIVPLLMIMIVDRVTIWWINRRGGLH
ncbi:MAG: hypothetical protein HZB43_09040 [candidate division Zixibacteria bacterium]|nr:hypothetical protein [candidate division Zixibacteria bacterium]